MTQRGLKNSVIRGNYLSVSLTPPLYAYHVENRCLRQRFYGIFMEELGTTVRGRIRILLHIQMHGQKSFNVRRVRLVMTSKKAIALVAVFSVLGVLAVVVPGYASAGSVTTLVVGYIIEPGLGFLGQLLLNVVSILIWVAQYNDFVNAAPVATGWIIVRDITNMFFIIVLLIIAFGTMLGVDQYSYRNKVLSRFLIMAIVVNFSRTITGLLIDFAQVVMLTFVNGFKEAAGGNFIDALKIGDVMQIAAAGGETDTSDVVIGFMIALAMIGMSLFLMIIMLTVFVVRIIYLWLLIILSPLAFFLKAVPSPAAQSYYAEWWKMFTQQVIVGPVLAFFLWLSLVSISTGKLTEGFKGSAATGESLNPATSAVFNADTLQEFVIAFALLLGGTMMAQRLSPQVAGKVGGAMKGAIKSGLKRGARMTGVPEFLGQRKAEREAGYKQRGARLRTRINAPIGAAKAGAARFMRSPSALRNMRQRKIGAMDEEIRRAQQSGNLDKAGKLTRKKADLQARIDKPTGRAGRAWDKVVGGVTGGAGAKEDRIIRGAGMAAIRSEMDEAKSRTDAEALNSLSDGSLTGAQRQAAALDLSGRKDAMKSPQDGERALAAMGGADEGMMNTFKQNMLRNNAMAGPDSARAWDSGNVPVDTMTDTDIQKNALKFANSASGFKMTEKMGLPKQDVLNKQLREDRQGLLGAPEGEKEGARAGRLSSLAKVESMILQTGVGKRTENAAAAGIKDGQFVGTEGQKDDARRKRMAESLSGLGAAKIGLAIPADQVFDAEGKITDVGKQIGASFMNNTGALTEMGRKEGKTTDQQDSLRAILEAIKTVAESPPEGTSEKDAERMKRTASKVETMRGLESYQDHKGATAGREGRQATAQREREESIQQEKLEQEHAEQKKAQITQMDVTITVNQENITNLEEQLTKKTGALDNAGSDISKTGPIRKELEGIKGRLNNLIEERNKLKKRRDKLAKG